MHTLLVLSSMLLVVVGAVLALRLLHRVCEPVPGAPERRTLQVLVLAAPVISLAVGVGGLHHFAGHVCFLTAPPWDYTLGFALPLAMGVVATGGLGLGLLRLALVVRIMGRASEPASPEVQVLADHVAGRLGIAPPRVALCLSDRPLALAYGMWKPTILLSSWMIERLDRRELEAVLAHELGHVARRDYLVIWLATVLRDAFFYLPTSRAAYRQLQREKELACDDLAIGATCRPLALASALAKVWRHALDGPNYVAAQPLVGAGELLEGRIARLLAVPEVVAGPPPSRLGPLGVGVLAFCTLVALQSVNVAIMLARMGCGPGSLL